MTNAAASNRPDGNVVEKGAQAYVLRSNTTRTVKTCSTTFASCTTLIDFNTTNVSPADLGLRSTDTAGRDTLSSTGRRDSTSTGGFSDGVATDMRPSAHGDVVHSRPIAINFGPDDNPRVVVFYGGNDGVLRAVNGNRSAAVGGVPAGGEYWAFMPPEFFGSIKRLYDQSPSVNYKGNTVTTPTPLPKPYGIDGPITLSKETDHAWVFAGDASRRACRLCVRRHRACRQPRRRIPL